MVIGAGVVLAAIQFMRPEMKQPPHRPLLEGALAPGRVINVMERACQDCHSNNAHWPWYANIAPVSLLIAQDVNRGKAFLNLSEWAGYSKGRKLGYLASMAQATRNKRMPPRAYRLMHASARLTEEERVLLENWAKKESRRLRADPIGKTAVEQPQVRRAEPIMSRAMFICRLRVAPA